MVAGLVDYMSTLVSGGTTICDSDKPPPPLPPKVNRVSSVDRALLGLQPAKPVCSPPSSVYYCFSQDCQTYLTRFNIVLTF